MIYPSDFESKIGFDRVRSFISDMCTSPLGREAVDKMKFSTSFRRIKESLTAVAEMMTLIRGGADIPLNHLNDVRPYLVEIKAPGSFMVADRLFRLLRILITVDEVGRFFSRDGGEGDPESVLLAMFGNIQQFPHIISRLNKVLNEFGEVKDNASPELYDIRDRLRHARASVSSVMRRVIERAASAGIIEPDTAPALRDGRLVIPVAAMSKRSISGIVHDRSATGKTVFVEPAEVVEASNRLRELEADERREIIKVLIEAANVIRPDIEKIDDAIAELGLLDFICAKAKFAIATGAELPNLSPRVEIEWYSAVNPVLLLSLRKQNREVVPLTLTLNKKNRFLVISGPNAGGKSVALKTVGLVQYMFQCGVLPTMRSNSHVGIFSNIFIDIGDEQSLENDLSTYSSHLRNMKFFLKNADTRTLVLADEIGSGTEPQIGGALARSILEKLGEAGTYGIVTTHYQNIKTFAAETTGFINGAMLYDRSRLRPLFQLSVGSPGSSFAVEIARKIGLPADVVDKAQELVGDEYVNADKYLLDISRDKKYWSEKRLKIKEQELKLNRTIEEADKRATDLKEQRSRILSEARKEAQDIVAGANARIERTIREIKEANAEREKTREVRRELEEYKRNVSKDSSSTPRLLKDNPKLKKRVQKSAKAIPEKAVEQTVNLQPGAYVKMENSAVTGRIIAIEGKKAEVAFGALRTMVQLDKLRTAQPPKSSAISVNVSSSDDGNSHSRRLNFNQELDVRGMRTDEALQAVTYFLDDAVQFAASQVRILHGTGTGALRVAIRSLLASNPVVSSYHDEDVRFGGAGITVVHLS